MALSACSKDRAATCHPLIVLDLFHSGGSNNLSSWDLRVYVQLLSHIQLFVAPWTVARQAPLSMGFSRQVYWSGQPLPSPGDLPDPGIESGSPASQADSLPSEPPREVLRNTRLVKISKELPSVQYVFTKLIYLKTKWNKKYREQFNKSPYTHSLELKG